MTRFSSRSRLPVLTLKVGIAVLIPIHLYLSVLSSPTPVPLWLLTTMIGASCAVIVGMIYAR